MEISVILSTYNSPEWLEKVVLGYNAQTMRDFELVISDDGSDQPTVDMVEKLKNECPFPIVFVTQKHDGFGKCKVLNQAIVACRSDYILVTDGDCVPRADFLETHIRLRRKGHFISGGYCKLPMDASKAITPVDIESQNPFKPDWLRAQGMRRVPIKLRASGFFAKLLNFLTPTTRSWNGHNSSGWKSDILAVNGFDERMRYGGLDREIGERLINKGIVPIQARHLAICVHLDHKRGYVKKEDLAFNHAVRKATRDEKRTWTDYGIVKKQ
jgi:glycosyltransferase involved in cell wall biosynthesis